jgi:hypothetical protein
VVKQTLKGKKYMPHKKKINKMSLKECETILIRLNNQTESQYYKEVNKQLNRLKDQSNKN